MPLSDDADFKHSSVFLLPDQGGDNYVAVKNSAVGAWGTVCGTIGYSSGKHYFELRPITGATATSSVAMLGIASEAAVVADSQVRYWNHTEGYGYNADGKVYTNSTNAAYGATFDYPDIIGVAVDLDNGFLYFAKNNTYQNSGVPTSGSSGTGAAASLESSTVFYPAMGLPNDGACCILVEIASLFSYSPPSGYSAWNPDTLDEGGGSPIIIPQLVVPQL